MHGEGIHLAPLEDRQTAHPRAQIVIRAKLESFSRLLIVKAFSM